MAARLVELSVQVREVLQGPLDPATAASSDESDNEPFQPVQVPCPPQSFAAPAPTQPPPAHLPGERQGPRGDAQAVAVAALENIEEHTPVPVPLGPFPEAECHEEVEPT